MVWQWFGRKKDIAEQVKGLDPKKEYILMEKPKEPPDPFKAGEPPPKIFWAGESPEGKKKKSDGENKKLKQLSKDADDRWFERKIQSILKDNAMKRLIPGKKFGELDHKRLHKVLTSDKLFMRPDSINGKQYNIVLLVDRSGSMDGYRIDIAARSVCKLGIILEKYAKVAILGFNDRIVIYKKFNSSVEDYSKLERKITRNIAGKGNHDHAGIRESCKMLKKQPGRRIIVVLSDGSPSCSDSKCRTRSDCGNGRFQSDKLIEEIRNAKGGKTDIIGIGIQSTAVENYYQRNFVVRELKDIYDGMIRELSKLIRRGV